MANRKIGHPTAPGLRGIGNKAQSNYAGYKRTYRYENTKMGYVEHDIRRYANEPFEEGHIDAAEHDKRIGKYTLELQNLNSRKESNTEAIKSKKHFEEHAAEYHDLALILAHMDGVTINVQQPLEIGQKVEVKMPEHK